MERDITPFFLSTSIRNFNPLSRMERDGVMVAMLKDRGLFQSTLSHGERRYGASYVTDANKFQSTLSHGERLLFSFLLLCIFEISIHSLAWRETIKKSWY